MTHQLSRDDNHTNRLSSFLLWEGNLETRKINQIKRNIYYLEASTGKRYILKGHSNAAGLRQQWDFFEKVPYNAIVPFVRFPNGKKEISTGANNKWTISPYIPGRKLNYEQPEDRERAVKAIKNFHLEARRVFVKKPVKKQLFYKRWNTRVYKLIETEHIFQKYHYHSLYQDIVLMMEEYLDIVSSYPWYKDQLNAEKQGLWVHGDVASHNFIQNEKTYLIDFDLLHCTSQLYEYIQLGQRFLPHIDWDVEQLLKYQMVDGKDMERFLFAVFIPSDVIREWLHFLHRNRHKQIASYLKTMEEEWLKRKSFLHQAKELLKT